MSNLEGKNFKIANYKIREEDKDYIVHFENHDDYFVVNDTGKMVLEFLSEKQKYDLLNDYLKLQFCDYGQNESIKVDNFLYNLINLGVLTTINI